MHRRPNVLLVITDQHRADHLGFTGNEVVRTPNLDSIASRGTVFENAWVANPVCMPNRSSIMTGRMRNRVGASRALSRECFPDVPPSLARVVAVGGQPSSGHQQRLGFAEDAWWVVGDIGLEPTTPAV